MVEGYVPTTQDEIGVVVNGVIAHVSHGWFVANNVPLVVGENTITAIATDFEGNTTSDSVVITSTGNSRPLELLAHPESGIGPLEVEFSAFTSLPGTLTRFTLDLNGDGIPEVDLPEIPDTLSGTYTDPGLHFASATVEDEFGNVFSDTVAIHVLSVEDLDNLLKSRWEGMKSALQAGEIDSALHYFSPGAQVKFRTAFEALATNLSEFVESLQPIRLVGVRNFVAEGFTNRIEDGELNAYFVYFTRDSSGLWKLTAM